MVRTMLRPLSLVALLASSLPALALEGPIVGDVEGGEFRPFPLAVAKVRVAPGSEAQKAAAETLTKVIRNDLDMSGAFQILDEKSFIDTDGVVPADIKYADWQNVGAQGLVKVRIAVSGKDL